MYTQQGPNKSRSQGLRPPLARASYLPSGFGIVCHLDRNDLIGRQNFDPLIENFKMFIARFIFKSPLQRIKSMLVNLVNRGRGDFIVIIRSLPSFSILVSSQSETWQVVSHAGFVLNAVLRAPWPVLIQLQWHISDFSLKSLFLNGKDLTIPC